MLSLQKLPLKFYYVLHCPWWVIMSTLCFGLFYLSLPLQDKNGLSTAILIVYLDSAFNLPVSTNPMQQPAFLISFFFF